MPRIKVEIPEAPAGVSKLDVDQVVAVVRNQPIGGIVPGDIFAIARHWYVAAKNNTKGCNFQSLLIGLLEDDLKTLDFDQMLCLSLEIAFQREHISRGLAEILYGNWGNTFRLREFLLFNIRYLT